MSLCQQAFLKTAERSGRARLWLEVVRMRANQGCKPTSSDCLAFFGAALRIRRLLTPSDGFCRLFGWRRFFRTAFSRLFPPFWGAEEETFHRNVSSRIGERSWAPIRLSVGGGRAAGPLMPGYARLCPHICGRGREKVRALFGFPSPPPISFPKKDERWPSQGPQVRCPEETFSPRTVVALRGPRLLQLGGMRRAGGRRSAKSGSRVRSPHQTRVIGTHRWVRNRTIRNLWKNQNKLG